MVSIWMSAFDGPSIATTSFRNSFSDAFKSTWSKREKQLVFFSRSPRTDEHCWSIRPSRGAELCSRMEWSERNSGGGGGKSWRLGGSGKTNDSFLAVDEHSGVAEERASRAIRQENTISSYRWCGGSMGFGEIYDWLATNLHEEIFSREAILFCPYCSDVEMDWRNWSAVVPI